MRESLVVLELVEQLLQLKRGMIFDLHVRVEKVAAHHDLALVDLRRDVLVALVDEVRKGSLV